MRRLLAILFWSVIAAAFIGPGTITTCAAAGASHGYALLWTLGLSILGCFVLQEAAARITIVSGRTLAQALGGSPGRGRIWNATLVCGAILLGCAAYQTGNVLGAVEGSALAIGAPPAVATSVISATAFLVLWLGTTGSVARAMGVVVGLMGLVFLATALALRPDVSQLARGLVVPELPEGSGLLIVALVGTTIVPYNLFLGSGLARGQRLPELRLGLAVALGVGGAISMAVLVVGGAIEGTFELDKLATALTAKLGDWGGRGFAIGLFCAGFSSAVTAPLAAAITARGLFAGRDDRWRETGWRYRGVWLVVIVCGLAFGLSGVRPVPAILLAQALNGMLLPIAAGFLLLVVNDRGVMGEHRLNRAWANAALALTFMLTVVLGLTQVIRAAAGAIGVSVSPRGLTILAVLLCLGLSAPLFRAAYRRRSR